MHYAAQGEAAMVLIYLYLMMSFFDVYFFTKVFTFKVKKSVVILLWGGLPFALIVVTRFSQLMPLWISTIMEIAIHVTLLWCLPKDKWRYRCGIFVLWNVLAGIVDGTTLFLIYLSGKKVEDIGQSLPSMIAVVIIMTAVYAIVFFPAIFFIEKTKSGMLVPLQSIILFAAFPFTQILMVIEIHIFREILGDTFSFYNSAWMDMLLILTAHFAIANIILYFTIKDLRKKKRLKEEYEFLQRHRQEEYAHMQAMIAEEDERRKFYHDINNNLSVIQTLIADGHYHEAQNIMDSACEKIKAIHKTW